MTAGNAPLLVFDGECAFCTRSVQFILARDRRRTLKFAPRGGDAGRAVRERHPELKDVESLLWVESRDGVERVLTHSAAVLAAAIYLGGAWAALGRLGRVVPRILRDPPYRAVASVRRRLRRGTPACLVVGPDDAARVLG